MFTQKIHELRKIAKRLLDLAQHIQAEADELEKSTRHAEEVLKKAEEQARLREQK